MSASELIATAPGRAWSRAAALGRVPSPPGWVVMVVLVAVFTWPVNPYPPAVGGYDISWIAGLAVGAHDGLHWGSQLDYTYGPLGWLTIGNFFYTVQGLVADLAIGVLYLAVLGLAARAIARAAGLVAAALVVFATARLGASTLDPIELVAPLVVALGIFALRQDAPVSMRQAGGLGLLAAVCALDKLSVAPIGLAVIAVLAVEGAVRPSAQSWRERLQPGALLLGSFLASLLLLWLLLGQSLFDLPAYVRAGWQLVNGYSDAEGLNAPGLNWQYVWAAVSGAALLLAALWQDRGQPWPRRAGILLLWMWFIYTEFRHAFVRLQVEHTTVYFAPVLLLAGIVLFAPGRWRAGLAATVITLACLWHVNAWNVMNLFNVTSGSIETQVNFVLSSHVRDNAESTARSLLRATYHFPPQLVATLRGQTVHFDPWEAALAWALPGVRWDPAPVFQSYNAYTSQLDDVNAAFLGGGRAPTYILRQNLAADGRDPRFESPRYMLALVCRYREVMVTVGWQLLERGPDRCGAPVAAGHEQARFGQRVVAPAPTPDSIVVGSFTNFSTGLVDTLRGLLFRRRIQYFAANRTLYRFVPGSASNPHLISVPACLDYNQAMFDPTPYRTIAIGHEPQLGEPGVTEPSQTYTVSFERIPFHCNA